MGSRVLVVDDSKAMRDVLCIVAEAAGFDVCATAENGRAAIELARAEQPDAVVLDQEMPILDGVSALPLIRDVAPDATIVMFSSSDDRSVVDLALQHGAAAFFRKGVESVSDVMTFLAAQAT